MAVQRKGIKKGREKGGRNEGRRHIGGLDLNPTAQRFSSTCIRLQTHVSSIGCLHLHMDTSIYR